MITKLHLLFICICVFSYFNHCDVSLIMKIMWRCALYGLFDCVIGDDDVVDAEEHVNCLRLFSTL